jgi:hypothetical protein
VCIAPEGREIKFHTFGVLWLAALRVHILLSLFYFGGIAAYWRAGGGSVRELLLPPNPPPLDHRKVLMYSMRALTSLSEREFGLIVVSMRPF